MADRESAFDLADAIFASGKIEKTGKKHVGPQLGSVAGPNAKSKSSATVTIDTAEKTPVCTANANATPLDSLSIIKEFSNVMSGTFSNMLKIQQEMRDEQAAMFANFVTASSSTSDELSEDECRSASRTDPAKLTGPPKEDDIVDFCNEIDKLLNDDVVHTSNDVTSDFLNDISQQYGEDVDKGPSIDTAIAEIINTFLNRKIPDEKVAKTCQAYAIPRNVSGVAMPKVNPQLWGKLSPTTRSNDLRHQKIQSRLSKGMIPIIQVLATLNQKRSNKESIDASETQNIMRHLFDAMALLSSADYEISMKRRDAIKPDLNPTVRSQLCSPQNKVTECLFGDDLTQILKDINEVNRVGQKIRHEPHFKRHSHAPYNKFRSPMRNVYNAKTGGQSTFSSKNWKKGPQNKRK